MVDCFGLVWREWPVDFSVDKLHFNIDRQHQFDRLEMGSHSDTCFMGEALGQLNQRHNTHVAYTGKVYDTSGFLAKHPHTTLSDLDHTLW